LGGVEADDDVIVVAHDGIGIDLEREEGGEMQQPGFDPGTTVLVGMTGDGIDAAKEGASDATGHDVVEARPLCVDEMSAGIGHD
jgi:hypothetical protein